MIRLLFATASILILCCIFSVNGLKAGNNPNSCLDVKYGGFIISRETVCDKESHFLIRDDIKTSDIIPVSLTQPPLLTVLCPSNVPSEYTNYKDFETDGGLYTDKSNNDTPVEFYMSKEVQIGNTCPIDILRTYKAVDNNGNMDSCVHTIRVYDTELPVLISPPDMTISGVVNSCDTMLTIPVATGFANCGLLTITNDYNGGGDNASGTFSLGETIVTFMAIDNCGNVGTSSMSVTVVVNPALSSPTNVTVQCELTQEPIFTSFAQFRNAGGSVNLTCAVDTSGFAYLGDTLLTTNRFTQTYSRSYGIKGWKNDTYECVYEITVVDEAPVFVNNVKLFSSVPTLVDDTIACYKEFLDPILAVAYDLCGLQKISVDTLPYIHTVCSGYQVNYRYIVTDANMNSDTVYSGFWVSKDTTAPMVTVLDTFINLSTDPGRCEATASLPKPVVIDDSGEYVIVNSIDGKETLSASFPIGETTFSYTISDGCGNITVVDQIVTVEDNEQPSIINLTKSVQVSISDDKSTVSAHSFVQDYYDNCGYVDIQVRRLDDSCDIIKNETFGDSLFFCCADVGSIHKVEVLVTDESGNQNSNIALVEVSDKTKPSFLIPVPDVTVSCDYLLDLTDLDDLGTFVLTGENRMDIIITDPVYNDSEGLVGQDGVYKENCSNGTTVSTDVVDMTTNGQGIIMRIFTITDASSNEAIYTQRIYVEDFSPITEEDIIWPLDIVMDGCESEIPTLSEGGVPTVTKTNNCHDIQYSSTDLVLDNSTSGCVYIRRTFKVIDSNTHDSNLDQDVGVWTKIQEIVMTNSIKPQFDIMCSDTLICAQGSGCSALVDISVSATDDCTRTEHLEYSYSVDIDNNGTRDMIGVGRSLSEMLPQGIHEVSFTVTDRCGNLDKCTRIIEVKECKPPTVACIALAIDLSPVDGTAQIWATDFDVSTSDNCTDTEDLLFSFSSDPTEYGRSYNCDSIGVREVEIWVTDEAGNQSFCVTSVDIQDYTNACGNGNYQNALVLGQVSTQNNIPITNTTVVIDGPEIFKDISTDDIGEYVFEELPMYNDYVITPSKNDEHLKGVSTLDLVLIKRHILSFDVLDSSYDIIAADVNSSEDITSEDIVELRKMILGVQDEFDNNESFRFVESNYVFADDQNPFPFMEETEFIEINKTKSRSDFVAIKIGDVNGSIEDLLSRSHQREVGSDKVMIIHTDDKYLSVGETVVIPIYSDDISSLAGLQFTVNYDSDYLEFVSAEGGQIALDNSQVADHHKASKTTIAWSNFETVNNLSESKPLVYFAYSVKRNGKLSKTWSITSDITDALAYDATYQKHDVELRFDSPTTPGFAMFQNQPNPFTEYTEIIFELPKAEEVSLQVFDNAGKLVHRQSSRYSAGKHQIRLNTEQLIRSGVYYYKIKAGDYSDARKMLKIK